MMSASPSTTTSISVDASTLNPYPWWSPRVWCGMRLIEWIQMLKAHDFAIRPSLIPWAFANAFRSPANGALGILQELFLGKAIRRTPIKQPVFVIGHWRSGTTFMHELLVQNERFAGPTNYQAFAPYHFLISEWAVHAFFEGMLPPKRPMDDVMVDWDTPQEDEFIHLAMGKGTPYLRMAFPHKPWVGIDYADLEGLDAAAVEAWKTVQLWMMQCVAYRSKRRLALKSPAHTGRVHVLREMFPDAKFIHLTREPYSMFASTVRMWRSLDYSQSLQDPTGAPVEDYVLTLGKRVYRSFHRHRDEIPRHQLCDVRYEDFIAAPKETLQNVYDQLELGDFSEAAPRVEQFLADRRSFATNRHSLSPAWQSRIDREWSEYIDRYGYGEIQPALKRA